MNWQVYLHFILNIIGTLQPHKWENAMTIDYGTWGFRRNSNLSQYLPMENLVWQLVSTVR
jgi:alpha-L-fucosidase